MVSNEGKEILRDIGLLAEHIICTADSYGEVSDKRKVVIDISETAARVKKEVKHISIKDLKTLNDKYGIAIFEYVDMLDAAIRKEPYNNNEVRFKADAVVSIVLDIIHREIRSNEIYRKISEGVINENVQV